MLKKVVHAVHHSHSNFDDPATDLYEDVSQIDIQVQMEYNQWDKDAESSCYKTYWWEKTLLSMILVHTTIM